MSVRILVGDCREILPTLRREDFAGVVFDPPYAVNWESGWTRDGSVIANDNDTSVRDFVLAWAAPLPVACFSSWRLPPAGAKGRVVWDKGRSVGMGDLSFPWFASAEDCYLLGEGWVGRRRDAVLRFQKPVGEAMLHPHEKPVALLTRIIETMPPGAILDPCCGSGSTLEAAQEMGRDAIGIEIDDRWIGRARERCAQRVLFP